MQWMASSPSDLLVHRIKEKDPSALIFSVQCDVEEGTHWLPDWCNGALWPASPMVGDEFFRRAYWALPGPGDGKKALILWRVLARRFILGDPLADDFTGMLILTLQPVRIIRDQ